MPALTVGKLRAIVEVDTTQLKKAKKDVKGFGVDIQKTFKSINRSIRNTGLVLTAAVSVPLAMFSIASVKAASDAVEMTNVFNVAFASIRKESLMTANRLADDFDLASSTSKTLLGDVGDLMIGFGLTGKAALSLANRTLRIAGDLTSFRNIAGGIPKATNAIFRGMLGISQALKPLGVALNQRSKEFRTQMKELMRTKGLTEQVARAELVLQAVIKQSINAVGDYNRTRGELANTTRRLSEMMKFMREEFGKILIQGLRLDVIIRALGFGMKVLSKTLSIIPGFLRPIIGAMVLLAIVIPPVVVGIAMLNLGILILQKNHLSLLSALKLESFFLKRYLLPTVIKAIVTFSSWAVSINTTSISLGGLRSATLLATGAVGKLIFAVKSLFAWLLPLLAPIAVLVGAIALAVGAVYWAYKRIKASMLASDIEAINGVLSASIGILTNVWTWIYRIGNALVRGFGFAFNIIDGLLSDYLLTFIETWKFIYNVVVTVVSGLTNVLGSFFSDLGKNIASVGKAFMNMFKGEFSAPKIDFSSVQKSMGDLKMPSFGDVGSQFTDIGKLWENYTDSLVPSFGVTAIDGAGGIGGAGVGGIGSSVPELAGAAIRGTSEAVKMENQRKANKKLEENTKKTADNTKELAEAFKDNQIILMPSNLLA